MSCLEIFALKMKKVPPQYFAHFLPKINPQLSKNCKLLESFKKYQNCRLSTHFSHVYITCQKFRKSLKIP